jgi:hypothetical protein
MRKKIDKCDFTYPILNVVSISIHGRNVDIIFNMSYKTDDTSGAENHYPSAAP